MNKTKGFTLIELLVVIAIIGILSSVVLASLNTARNKGSDAAIKSQLAAIRPQAEIYYDSNGGYGTQATTTCASSACSAAGLFADATIQNQVRGVYDSAASNVLIGASASYWAAAAPLKAGGYWCVDSTGASRQTTSLTAAMFTTPANWTVGCQ